MQPKPFNKLMHIENLNNHILKFEKENYCCHGVTQNLINIRYDSVICLYIILLIILTHHILEIMFYMKQFPTYKQTPMII